MIRQKLYRPSLKVTRQTDQHRAGDYTFGVWSPFTGTYQIVDSIEDGMRRVVQLASLIREMWLREHPKQDTLADVPDTATGYTSEWAEFRINATTYPSYDTRHCKQLRWVRASGLGQAAKTTCAMIGCALPRPSRDGA
jgi:hypothetical protein